MPGNLEAEFPMTPIPFTDFGGNGPLLHFAHANAYPAGCYRQFAARLASRYHVLAIDHRPLWPGQSPAGFSDWHIFAQDFIQFCDEQGLRDLIGVGHSLGAVLTMSAAVTRPGLFRALVLIEPVFLPPQWLAAVRSNPQAAEQMPFVQVARNRRNHWPSRQAAFDHLRPKAVFGGLSDEALWDFVQHGLRPAGDGSLTLAYSRDWEAAIYAHPPTDVWELVPQVRQPTLAIRAAQTDTLHPQAWAYWQELQPQATFLELPNTGHLLPLEQPGRVADEIIAFLDNV